MKNSLLIVKAALVIIFTSSLLVYSRPSNVLYCARPVTEGTGVCELGIDDATIPATPHYVYLATENKCSLPCSDSTAIRSINFKPFK